MFLVVSLAATVFVLIKVPHTWLVGWLVGWLACFLVSAHYPGVGVGLLALPRGPPPHPGLLAPAAADLQQVISTMLR